MRSGLGLLLVLSGCRGLVQPVPSSKYAKRRFVLERIAQALTPVVLLSSWPVSASSETLGRLKSGFQNINFLLANWDSETFKSCPTTQVALAAECDRLPDKIPTALGLRSTTAPLYKVEKLFQDAIQSGDVDDIDSWTEATDAFIQHSTSAQEYAYTASFGEYNPSGGKDQVAKYMDLSKKELVQARDALRDVLTQLAVDIN